MSIGTIIRESLRYAWTCKSLWLFGFFVGMATGGSSSGGSSGGGGGQAGGMLALPLALFMANLQSLMVPIVLGILVIGVAAILAHFISEAALIEGVLRARQGRQLSLREGFRAGWAHWAVLFRIAVIYFGMVIGSLLLLAVPVFLAFRAVGPLAAAFVAVPALLVAVPWLITLHLLQAFAARIAVFEDRHAIDALKKARLFLHGRLMHGLKLIAAALIGTIIIAIPGILAILAIVIPMVATIPLLSFTSIILGCLALVPVGFIFAAVVGIFRSSVWTIGYLTQVES